MLDFDKRQLIIFSGDVSESLIDESGLKYQAFHMSFPKLLMQQKKKFKSIDFKDILGAHTAEFGQEESEAHKDVWQTQGRWSFKFVIVTQERRYHLHAASEDERKLWMLDFELILKESKKETKSRYDDAKDLYDMLPEENQRDIDDRMKIAK